MENGFALGFDGSNVLALINGFFVIPLLFSGKLSLDLLSATALHPSDTERSEDDARAHMISDASPAIETTHYFSVTL